MRFHQVVVKKGKRYSDWEYPVMKKYQMKCCDCGLVHEINFKVVEIVKELKNGYFHSKDIKDKKFRVALQARRNNKLTNK